MMIIWVIPPEQKLGPLTELRSPHHLRCGALTIREKILHLLNLPNSPENLDLDSSLHPRYLPTGNRVKNRDGTESWVIQEPTTNSAQSHSQYWLWIDASLIIYPTEIDKIVQAPIPSYFTLNGKTVLAKTSALQGEEFLNRRENPLDHIGFLSPQFIPLEGIRILYPWQVLEHLSHQLISDINTLSGRRDWEPIEPHSTYLLKGEAYKEAQVPIRIGLGVIINAESYPIYLSSGVEVEPGVIFNSQDGPIWVDHKALVQSGAILKGPLYIGQYSIVRPGTKVIGNISLGPHCRVGGEISHVVIQGYSNKQHGGYLGTSYIGEWVNLGAGTDNSDLKNNYRPISLSLYSLPDQEFKAQAPNWEILESNSIHLGVFIGDYTRTAIGTRLNSGGIFGTCCHILSSDFPQKTLPPFSWVTNEGTEVYHWEKAIDTIKVIMSRRGKTLSPLRTSALAQLFRSSQALRNTFKKPPNLK